MLSSHHLLTIQDLSADDIYQILDTAKSFAEVNSRAIKKLPTLRGRTVINLFFENSTRTRTSFEIAAKRLSADAINMNASASSTSKGESLADTAATLNAMNCDIIICRHRYAGSSQMLTRYVSKSAHVINAGDGKHQHPTQTLLDLYSIREIFGTFDRLLTAGFAYILGDAATVLQFSVEKEYLR